MSAQHTPGPWTLDDRGCKFIVHKTGDGYITRDICRMDGSTMAAFAQEANARLIAAAPELLESLQEVTFLLEALLKLRGEPSPGSIGAKARAAIAKATTN